MDLAPGTRLGRNRVVALLGRGGMGAVYRAEDESLGRTVALKVLGAETGDPELRRRFLREGRAVARVVAPNVVAIFEVGEERGVAFMSFELVPGGSLKDVLRTRGALPWREAVTLAAGVARGLAAAHAAGLIHRDVKPDNVLVAADGTPKLGDFGVARADAASGLTKGGLTKTGEVLGTLEYMAPEQCEGLREIDARADLYALGATLHALLTGRPPFEGSGYALVKKHLLEAPRAPGASVPGIPRALDELVLRLLAKEPSARPSSAAFVATALDALASGSEAGVAKKAPPRARARLAVAAVSLVALALAGVVVSVTRGSGERLPRPPVPSTRPPAPPAVPPVVTKRQPLELESLLASKTGRLSLTHVLGRQSWKACGWGGVAAFSPDGSLALTGGDDGMLVLTEVATGRHVRAFHFDDYENVLGAVFSPDHLFVLAGTVSGALVLFDVRRGEIVSRARHEGPAGVAYLRDGRAVSFGGRLVRSWDLRTERGSVRDESAGATATVYGAPLPDGRMLIAREAGGVERRDVTSGRSEAVLEGMTDKVRALAVSASGRRVAIASAERPRVSVHGLDETAADRTFDLPEPICSVAFSPDMRRVVAGGGSGGVYVLDTEDGSVAWEVHPHRAQVVGVAFSPDGRLVLTSSHDATTRLLDIVAKREVSRIEGPGGPVDGLAVSPDGRLVAAGDASGRLRLWDGTGEGPVAVSDDLRSPITAATFCPEPPCIMVGLLNGTVRVLDMSLAPVGEPIQVLWDAVRSISFSKDGSRMCVAGNESVTKVFSRERGGQFVELAKLPVEQGWVLSAALHPEGGRVLTSTDRGAVHLWDLSLPATPVHTFAAKAGSVTGVSFVEGEGALAVTDRGGLTLWDIGSKAPLANADGGGGTLALSQERKLVAVGGHGRTPHRALRLHDLEGLGEVDRVALDPTGDYARALAFAPGGKVLYVGTARGVVLRFNVR